MKNVFEYDKEMHAQSSAHCVCVFYAVLLLPLCYFFHSTHRAQKEISCFGSAETANWLSVRTLVKENVHFLCDVRFHFHSNGFNFACLSPESVAFFCLWLYPLVDQTNTIFIFLEIMMLLRLTSDDDENGEYVTSFFCTIINERTLCERVSELKGDHNDSSFIPLLLVCVLFFRTNIWISRRWVRKC